jgi:hypothetical protein
VRNTANSLPTPGIPGEDELVTLLLPRPPGTCDHGTAPPGVPGVNSSCLSLSKAFAEGR